MIFALIDYLNYKSQSDRYSLESGSNLMCGAFENKLPESIIDILEPGDFILHGDFNWYISWLIMYLTNSQISHISLYAGDRMVLHTGLDGVTHEPIENIFRDDTRLLPAKIPTSGEKRESFDINVLPDLDKHNYPLNLVIRKALKIIFARYGRFYTYNLFIDMLLVVFFISALLSIYSIYAAIILIMSFLLVIGINLTLSFYRPLPPDIMNGVPCDALHVFRGSAIIFNPESVWSKRVRNEENA